MRNELPERHGLDERVQQALVHWNDGNPSITDVQYEALAAGVGRGESVLVLSPTSTGKTQIALWAMANRLHRNGRIVYLVTHRALARQKFQELLGSYLLEILGGDKSKICLATGDEVVTGDGIAPKNPLQADIVVATYEKYLAVISGAGVPGNVRDVCLVCDEVQLIGDAHRGQNVEVLLTLLRRAGWGQLVALSAVLTNRDAADLADWLGVALVIQARREKHLVYECWRDNTVVSTSTENPGRINESRQSSPASLNCLNVVRHFLAMPGATPIIVFCMKKDDATRLARELIESGACSEQEQLSIDFLDMPETNAASLLSQSLIRRVAVHNADLTDEERMEVERRLISGSLDVVFATSSLAAGVNFPFATAIFNTWERWDGASRAYVPIDSSEFHNMAGRAGRMGFDHEHGRVIFFAGGAAAFARCSDYLDLTRVESLESRIEPTHFSRLVLQLIASGISNERRQLIDLIGLTFSGLREADQNATAFATWPTRISSALDDLIDKGLVSSQFSGQLSATPVGKAVAHSGLQPATCNYLLSAVVALGETLVSWLPTAHSQGRIDDLLFTLARICFSSPEYLASHGGLQTRFLPWPLQRIFVPGVQQRLHSFNDLRLNSEPDVLSSALIATDWANGAPLLELENLASSMSAGMIRDLIRNLAWMLQGFSSLLTAATDTQVPVQLRPAVLQIDDLQLKLLRRLPRFIGRMVRRLNDGLPEEVLWLLELNAVGQPFRITREDVLRLRRVGISSPLAMMEGTPAADSMRASAFPRGRPSPQAKANWVRDRARSWKMEQRRSAANRQIRRADRCSSRHLVEQYYSSLGTQFETAFEEVLSHLGVPWQRLDDRSRIGAPDYLLRLVQESPIVVELKTRELDRLVDYNRAVEVLSASEVHGYRDAFCVTLCHPGVDPSVPGVIASCGRLSVVESHDLGEALLRICEGDLSFEQAHRWLTTPGQATTADLPFKEYRI
ncbi:ATP-dependent DNA helicase [Lysobacter enzymogenes]|uniref:ATP-dependent DNA helicase n=1 Tax=Lysobacter enzymogenes TaxID=69 RepID=A0A0S2DFI4_LYSEN|nr:DEAD/DEAH box helicase [Lysobacter enzymogenes]ALN57335.1 ATP-dependent DNA helicase [Lysobacter enzymogenes]QCW25964.1 DEAD/DEAH box helicase [Lysobacter enzymogenes]